MSEPKTATIKFGSGCMIFAAFMIILILWVIKEVFLYIGGFNIFLGFIACALTVVLLVERYEARRYRTLRTIMWVGLILVVIGFACYRRVYLGI